MYSPYINYEEYVNMGGNTLPPEEADKYLKQASRHIDSLTYNRINKYKFENLTSFQQELIKEVTSNLAEFEYNNQDLLDNVLSSYSINGVSMSFEQNWNIKTLNGVAIKVDDYNLLAQTGLTVATFRF